MKFNWLGNFILLNIYNLMILMADKSGLFSPASRIVFGISELVLLVCVIIQVYNDCKRKIQ